MPLKLYYDLMSQPSRSLYILLNKVKCDFEHKKVALREAEHYGEEFTKINRLQKVPLIDHNGFILTESVAIMKYLAREGIIPEDLYPSDSKKQARVDEFLEWQHIGLRLPLSMYFRVTKFNIHCIVRSIICFPIGNDHKTKTLEFPVQTYYNKHISTLVCYCLDSNSIYLGMAGFVPKDGYSNITVWWPKVRAHFSPYYEEAHVILNKIVAKNDKLKSKI